MPGSASSKVENTIPATSNGFLLDFCVAILKHRNDRLMVVHTECMGIDNSVDALPQ